MAEKFSDGGFLFERENGKIISATRSSVKIELKQVVFSNGRDFHDYGTEGVVEEICLPNIEGRTSDILRVSFEKGGAPANMKFKDLIL